MTAVRKDNGSQASSLKPQASNPKPQASSLIILQEVSKTYGTGDTAVRAVNRVNLKIQAGELVLLLGPSGAGKTTLLSLIGGLLHPTSGTIHVAGTALHTLSPSALSRFRLRQIGFIFQFFQLLEALTARENVEVVLRLGGYARQAARQRAEELLTHLGLGARLTHLPRELSGGEKQRVALARALALQPPLLIADEPTGSLDSHSGEASSARRAFSSVRSCSGVTTASKKLSPGREGPNPNLG